MQKVFEHFTLHCVICQKLTEFDEQQNNSLLALPFIGSIPQTYFFLHMRFLVNLSYSSQSFWFCFYSFIFIFFKHPEICITSLCRIPFGMRSMKSAGFNYVNPFSPTSAGKSACMTPCCSLEELPVLFSLHTISQKIQKFTEGLVWGDAIK